MASNDRENPQRQSRGVRVNENDFASSSEITATELNEHDYRQLYEAAAHDADQSSVEVEVPISSFVQSSSENDANYYQMKTSSRKGLKTRPSVVTFQQLNPRFARCHSKRRPPPHLNRSRWELQPERNPAPANVVPQTVPSAHLINQVESYQSSDQFQQPQNFRSKLCQIFARFRQPERLNRRNNSDIEAGRSENQHAEFYHFDHGEPNYYRTTDNLPHLASDECAQHVHDMFTKLWAEFFGYINVLVMFLITFLIQFYRFILYGIVRAVLIGVLQTTSDYLLKPALAFVFNGLLQPIFTLTRNVFQSICDISEPLMTMVSNILRPFTECVRAFRIVDVKTQNKLFQPEPRYSNFQGQTNV